MRETIRRKPLVLLALLATLFMTSGCQSTESSPVPAPSTVAEDQTIATVGGTAISRGQLLERLLSSHGTETLRSMMLAEAVKEEAKSLQVEVSSDELEQELRLMKQGYEDEDEFYKAMEEQLGMSREEVLEDARYRLLLEKLSIQGVTVTETEIDEYLREHSEEFQPRTQYQLAQIVVQTEKLAEGLLTRLTEGAEFGDLAREYSIDEFTADEGGELGWIEDQDPFESQAVFQAASEMQVGEVSGPIETDHGYVILRLDGRSEVQTRSEEDNRAEARRLLALGKAVSTKELEHSLLNKYHAEVKEPSLRP
ncbi:peptidylprolyl isomerase [Cohnella luojiensis]|nr:peptidylprolyl isomerase [Cohnella luojiensis]